MTRQATRARVYQLPDEITARNPAPQGLTPAEVKVWREWMPVLQAAGVVRPADLLMFAEYCKAKARRDDIEEKLGGEYWTSTQGGGAKGHPGWAVLDKAERRIDRLAARLGLDTMGRLAAELKAKAVSRQLDIPIPAPVPRQEVVGKKEAARQASLGATDEHWGDDLTFPGTAH